MHCPNCGFDPTDFQAVLSLVTVRLQQKGRISYRALQYEFGLDEPLLEALREELIFGEQVANDEEGRVLVWIGNIGLESRVQRLESEEQGQIVTGQTLDPRACYAL